MIKATTSTIINNTVFWDRSVLQLFPGHQWTGDYGKDHKKKNNTLEYQIQGRYEK
jgi:hypothetical protein